MTTFANKDLAELAHQLLMSPKHKRLEQIHGIDTLLGLIEPDRAYPYDMVCFHITGYRSRRNTARPAISSGVLIGDLVTLAEQLTRKNAIPISEIEAACQTFEEVAESLSVSTKTIRRWRRRGLMGFRAAGEDGIARLVYLKSTVDRFVERNRALVERGASFRQLTATEKRQIVQLARQLLGKKRLKLHVAARKISEQTGRAVETIRYTLRRYDEAHPEKALFTGNGLPAASDIHRQIWQAVQHGDSLVDVAQALGIPQAQAAQAIREMTARQLKCEPPTFMPNDLFAAPNADALILDIPRPPSDSTAKVRAPRDLPAYLRSLYSVPLMTFDQEQDAFRRYNYLKYKAVQAIAALDVCTVTQGELDCIARLTERYEAIRQEIVAANLRLVVSIAKRHVGWSPRFFEVISDGNMSLMRAVEKFDYSRGFKFSTYASWAIMKNYARTVPEEHYHFSRYVTGQDELIDATADHRAAQEVNLDETHLTEALQASMADLTDRERTIVTEHFGLFGRKETATLEEIGRTFGVTKERIRQIERRAIAKIKDSLSPALADLLPG